MLNTAEKTASHGRNHVAVKTHYTQLLSGFAPVGIESRAEHDRALKAAAALTNRDDRSAAETSLLKLLAVLIEDYEQKRYSMGRRGPARIPERTDVRATSSRKNSGRFLDRRESRLKS